ncbi:L-aspartate oxidase [Brachybacterium endophyticum]|uniref:L-aspartate oxidase n=1 Tax=Brachybacterium endophyticum TaxID=2182385 RepID=A0A2U2RN78_9MICO|nr:L-aspartate oxidase [Brachybacterium endophyticum]PWH07320.1 L-aspartate oxidase [Brachybacterium endophyticum]
MTGTRETDVLVVGSGIAGLTAALRASRTARVLLVSKGALDATATARAQGGIAGALDAQDSSSQHAADTHVAGAGLCHEDAVRVLCEEGPDRIGELIEHGVAFDRAAGPGSPYAQGLEGAHSRPRILHAGGDATGRAIQDSLVTAARRAPIEILEHTALIDLLVQDGLVEPAVALPGTPEDVPAGTPLPTSRDRASRTVDARRVRGAVLLAADGSRLEVHARVVVLATGGSGQLFSHTTNPAVATGDGAAVAWRAGAELADLEFVQFHPTALTGSGFLISEAVRGDGALLRDERGRRFLPAVDPSAELAPRDVVARAIARTMAEQGGRPVLLDATALGSATLARRFPTIDAATRASGLDWASGPIPVTPAAHYAMGGIRTDLQGRTSLPGLFAAGECACTGVHGANRLASNSLLEGAVFGARAGEAAGAAAAGTELAGTELMGTELTGDVAARDVADAWRAPGGTGANRPSVAWSRRDLQDLMWKDVGLLRTGRQLAHAAAVLDTWSAPAPSTLTALEDRNLLDLARLTVAAALARTGSAGAHHRLDDPALPARTVQELHAC